MKNGICPKCNNSNIKIKKDILHANGGGNIITKKHIFRESNTALFTFYICMSCGYVEHYLDDDELKKL